MSEFCPGEVFSRHWGKDLGGAACAFSSEFFFWNFSYKIKRFNAFLSLFLVTEQ